MKRILIVSTYPYLKTNRGLDVLTEAFEEENWEVTHLTFPIVFYSPEKEKFFPTKVREVFADHSVIPYIDAIMFWLPKPLFQWIVRRTAKTAQVDFREYDYVLLESGKPLFLLDSVPKETPLIYRQSDSVKLILGKHPDYVALEDKAIERAMKVIVVKEIYTEHIPPEAKGKTVVIRNGFSMPLVQDFVSPYPEKSVNVVYMGLTPLDYPTLKYLITENPGIHFHIAGPCLKPWEKLLLKRFPNFHFHEFLPPDKYLPLIKFAHAAIIPYKDIRAVRWMGFTSKYMTYMYFGIPIISHVTGDRKEFDGLNITLVDSRESFHQELQKTVKERKTVKYPIDFDFYSKESRKREYRNFIRESLAEGGS